MHGQQNVKKKVSRDVTSSKLRVHEPLKNCLSMLQRLYVPQRRLCKNKQVIAMINTNTQKYLYLSTELGLEVK